MFFLTFITYLNGAILLSSCSPKDGVNENLNELEGKWISKANPQSYLILNKDGSGFQKNFGQEIRIIWRLNGNQICIKNQDDGVGGIEMCVSYSLEGNELKYKLGTLEAIYNRK